MSRTRRRLRRRPTDRIIAAQPLDGIRFLSSSAIRTAKAEIPAFLTSDKSFKIMKDHPIEGRLLRTVRTIYSCRSRI
jgi:hypothetical protein